MGISTLTPDSPELLSQFLKVITELIVDLLQRCLQARLSLPVANWREHDRIAVRAQFDLRVCCDLQQIEDGFVDDDRKTVAVPDVVDRVAMFRFFTYFSLAPIQAREGGETRIEQPGTP